MEGGVKQSADAVSVWVQRLALGVFIAALLAGLCLPIYSDEVGWRLQERAAYDGVDKLFTSRCGPNTLAVPPFWMMPARYYSAVFNSLFDSPLYLRISGILYALAWTGMVLSLVRRIAADAEQRAILSAVAIGFISLGTMPLLLVMSRPEQPIMLSWTAALLIALAVRQDDGSTARRIAWLRAAGIVLLSLIAMSYHVKGVGALPLFLVCIAVAARGHGTLLPRLLGGLTMLAAGIVAGRYWIDRFLCPNDAVSRESFLQSTGAALVANGDSSHIGGLLTKALGNVSLYLYPGTVAPRPYPMGFWLPIERISTADAFAWFLVIVALWTVAFVVVAWCLLHASLASWRERRLDSRLALAVALLALGIGWSAAGFTGVYEATFTVPMLALAVVLALSMRRATERVDRITRWAAMAIGVVSIASIVSVAAIFGPALVASTRQPGYVPGQPLSITPFGYDGVRRDILGVMRQCGIDPVKSRGLMVDDLTYFPLMHSRLPDHRAGLYPLSVASGDPIAYLRASRSDGIVSWCGGLPADVRMKAKRQGGICCLAPSDF